MWPLLALAAAVSVAARDAVTKRVMRAGDEYRVSLVLTAATAAVLLGVAATQGLPPLRPSFWPVLAASGAINAVSTVMLVRAVHRSDLSLVSPLLSFTPLFMLATSPIMLGELPSSLGIVGVAAIVAGSYLLRADERGRSWTAPFRALLRDSGARLMLGVAFLYSIGANLDKLGIRASAPVIWAGASFAAAAVLLAGPGLLRRGPDADADGNGDAGSGRGVRGGSGGWGPARLRGLPLMAVAAGLSALGIAAQMYALTMTLAAYVIAVKRTSVLFGVLLGAWLFDEPGLRSRLLGALVMLGGFVLITLS